MTDPGDNSSHAVPMLDYGCTAWRQTSQTAADLYRRGTKLWTKSDLQDIELQLAQSVSRPFFTVRSITGQVLNIRNPAYGHHESIWTPHVKYQGYWQLVREQPSGPEETYLCSYVIDWTNRTARDFRSLNPLSDFEHCKLLWDQSASISIFTSQMRIYLGERRVIKIVCLGLGDFYREPPQWLKRQIDPSQYRQTSSIIQHSIALTLSSIGKERSSDITLLAQDPGYTAQATDTLERHGFSVVGHHGAGGFAEIDHDSVVFSAWPEAPVKQLIADLARPALIISTGFDVFNNSEKAFADADSPRTRDLWQDYDMHDFPISEDEPDVTGNLKNLKVYVRKTIQ